jgi:hypothetical protein
LEPLKGALQGVLGEKLEAFRELQQSQLPEDQLIQFHRMAFGALVALLLLQAAAPTAVPSLFWAYISQPLLRHNPSNTMGGFWYGMGVALWLAYGLYHVTQGALLGRTHSRWPWSPMRTLGLALIPLYNVYGSWHLFSEAFQRLARESDKQGRAVQAKSALTAAMAMIGASWGMQLAADLGVEIPDVVIQGAAWARAAAELAALGLAFSMMIAVTRKIADEGSVELEEGESPHPLSQGPSGPSPGLTLTTLVGVAVFGLVIYYAKKEGLECPPGASLTTTPIGSGERALFCAKDGVPEGPWRVRTKDGGAEEFMYVAGRISGAYKTFYPSGAVRETGSFNDKRKTGNWVRFSEDGTKLQQETYLNDLLEGTSVKFFPNGQASEQRTFAGGKLNGKYFAFHGNGKKSEEGDYWDGNKIGHWTTWNETGTVMEEKDYARGRAVAAAASPGTMVMAQQGTPVAPMPTTGSPGAPGTTVIAGTPGATVEPDQPGTAAPVSLPPSTSFREVTEHRFFAGRTQEWWEDRLTRIKQRVGAGELDAKVYALTKRRAQLNGLEVMDAQDQVKVRIAVTASAPQGGPP